MLYYNALWISEAFLDDARAATRLFVPRRLRELMRSRETWAQRCGFHGKYRMCPEQSALGLCVSSIRPTVICRSMLTTYPSQRSTISSCTHVTVGTGAYMSPPTYIRRQRSATGICPFLPFSHHRARVRSWKTHTPTSSPPRPVPGKVPLQLCR